MPSVTTYCDKADLKRVGVAAGTLDRAGTTAQDTAIEDASRFMDSFFRSRYTLPFSAVGGDVKVNCAAIACWYVMRALGFNPEGDSVIRTSYEDALSWLKGVASGTVNPDVTSPGATGEGAPTSRARMASNPSRGWSTRTTGARTRGGFVGGPDE